MASIWTRALAWLALALPTQASFWTATLRLEREKTTVDDTETTITRTISSGITPTVSAISTDVGSPDFGDIQYVYIYYPFNAVPESALEPVSSTSTMTNGIVLEPTQTAFSMPVTYTAPATCSRKFSFTTEEFIQIPTIVYDQITPTSKITPPPIVYTWTDDWNGKSGTATGVFVTWYLSAGAAPFNQTYGELNSTVSECRKPGERKPTHINPLTLYILIIPIFWAIMFLLGFLESWFWFRRLMLGRSALRFGTFCWIFISFWVLCFTRKQPKRSPEDQVLLRQQWESMSSGKAWELWWKIGFRTRYPKEWLGEYSKQTVGIGLAGALGTQVPNHGHGMGEMPPPAYAPSRAAAGMLPPIQGYGPQNLVHPHPGLPPQGHVSQGIQMPGSSPHPSLTPDPRDQNPGQTPQN
ncbi:hypothetical protein BCR34DRAFT_589677 [Clohesyomyces aquaticus]|uniref:Uncharacterized protein n=1 Tax=Clohesyomyces aquaticus TaxID=1231657 RepID=A0A1Y1ZFC4_9PLEO|nr:hypothetical protein BCR34DRAFT_589677 [Clohesyomyces aquaticus]